MSEPSPPPFIVFRAPKARAPYQRALDLVGLVHELIDKATARFHLKDRLDRATTQLVFELGRAEAAGSLIRWRHVRAASVHAGDVATVLDILAAQRAAPVDELERAQAAVRDLRADLLRRPTS